MTPLMHPDQAANVLDQVLYERVADLFDFAGLFELEQQLWSGLQAAGAAEDQIAGIASALLDRALLRLTDDPRRHVDIGRCLLCEEDAQRRNGRKAS